MYKKVSADEKKKIQEKYREEFKERFRQRIENGEVMDFT
jgi:uncharacterized protein YnzC (UPF0291/DUF896 family)